jgi:hypothetical protein
MQQQHNEGENWGFELNLKKLKSKNHNLTLITWIYGWVQPNNFH